MEKYQVIARKFRPQTFAEVIGQEAIVTTLKNALRFQKLAHGYLFCGLRGSGKTSLARLFAKALNCHNLTSSQEPCNSCPSCLEITSGHSLDVLEIDGASNRGIDDIRQINETVGYAPATGKYKIYLIDEVHMLTKEAFNALLKTLEEPPAQVKFFFATTEPHKVLPTIISRCQRFDLKAIPVASIQAKLKAIAVELDAQAEDEALQIIAERAEGSLRDAESLFDQILCYTEGKITAEKVSSTLGLVPKSTFFELDQAMAEGNLSFAFELAEKIYASGKDVGHFLEELMEHIRTLLMIKMKQAAPNEKYLHSASLYTQEQCLGLLDFLIRWSQEIGKNAFKRITLEMVLLHILRSRRRLGLDALVKRLVDLEKKVCLPAEEKEAVPLAHAAPVVEQVLGERKPTAESVNKIQQNHETLMRFASVELEGILKKG